MKSLMILRSITFPTRNSRTDGMDRRFIVDNQHTFPDRPQNPTYALPDNLKRIKESLSR